MKAMKVKDLRNDKPGQIEGKLTDARDELMKLRFQQVTGQLTDTSRVRMLRRDIARMLTILREQQTAEAKEGEA
ncbi:MAG TPA: 50S ribosomal protein L29 [Anaerolineales bacterium]|jgi:large subunit ribosomal protein L29|nr:50S ribosomal protein L29 [Anaerolineales bacterium]HQX17758.1 50S ribosomal protein L29 [Anaerolineales bacterium]